MKNIIDSLFLSSLFAILIMNIVLIGILIVRLFENKTYKKGIILFIILFCVSSFKTILDNYVYFKDSPSDFLVRLISIFTIFPFVLSLAIFFYLWKRLDKKIFSVTVVFIILIMGVNFSKMFSSGLFIDILNLIALLGVNLAGFFLTIKFLIDTSKEIKEDKNILDGSL